MFQRYRAGALRAPSVGSRSVDVLSADWPAICRRIVTAQEAVFARTPGRAERTVYEGVGEGGDRTLVIDRECEDAVFAELEALAGEGAAFTAISEERGEVAFAGGGEARVVIDPIDGSLNARRTLPAHSLSLAVSSGPSMADVEFGYVYDFGAGEEFAAGQGEGATLNGEPIAVSEDGERLELLGVEAASPGRLRPLLEALDGSVYRIRVVGSIAIAAAYVAAGRLDGMAGSRPCRSVDAAAAQLIVREAGGLVAFADSPLDAAGLDLEARYTMLAAAGPLGLETIRL
jgi:myo-inositol-1(or 4)-monophosphatase